MTITNSGIDITVSGTETGDALRSYMVSNSVGTIVGRNIEFPGDGSGSPPSGEITFNTGTTFTDSNSSWHFYDGYRWNFQSAGVVLNFTDMTIQRSGSKWGNDFYNDLGFEANWENVQYLMNSLTQRSDFFSNGPFTFNLDGVKFINYASVKVNVLHFQSAATIRNIQIVNRSTSTFIFEPGGPTVSDTQHIIGILLDDVQQIYYGQSAAGGLIIEDLTWELLTWTVRKRGGDVEFLNPIHPSGWLGYSIDSEDDDLGSLEERYTHDIKVVDEDNTAIVGATAILYRSDDSTEVYNEQTIAGGVLASGTEEVRTAYNATTVLTVTYYSSFLFYLYKYGYSVVASTKELQDGQINEVVISVTDSVITETNKTTVDAYTTIDDAFELYDRAAAFLDDNFGTYRSLLVGRSGSQIELGSLDLVIDATAGTDFAYNGTDTITIKSSAFTGGAIGTGQVDVNNGATIGGSRFDIDVYLNSAEDLSNLTINGEFHITTGGDDEIDLTSVTVSTPIFNDSGSNTLTITSLDGSVFTADDPGTGDGEIEILSPVFIDVNVKDQAGVNIENALVYIDDDLGVVGNIANTTTDASGNITQSSYSGIETTGALRVRLYGYKYSISEITLTQNSSTNIILITDPQQQA